MKEIKIDTRTFEGDFLLKLAGPENECEQEVLNALAKFGSKISVIQDDSITVISSLPHGSDKVEEVTIGFCRDFKIKKALIKNAEKEFGALKVVN